MLGESFTKHQPPVGSRRERGSGLDHLLPALWSEHGWHDAFSGRKPDKTLLYTRNLAVQAVLWNPVNSKRSDGNCLEAEVMKKDGMLCSSETAVLHHFHTAKWE